MRSWDFGTMGPWDLDTVPLRDHGTLGLWDHLTWGPLVFGQNDQSIINTIKSEAGNEKCIN